MLSALSYFRLGCLVQEFLPHRVLNGCVTLQLFWSGSELPTNHPAKYTTVVPDELRASLGATVKVIQEECTKLRFKASRDILANITQTLDDPKGLLQSVIDDAKQVEGRIVSELRYTSCFALEGEDEDLFLKTDLFGEPVAKRFDKAVYDIAEAGKCLAFDRGTACVFHLMRVLELGLQELGRDLQLAKIDENWEKLLNDLTGALNALPFKSESEKEYRARRQASVAHLRNVKMAWRNRVMHPADKYTVEEAKAIWVHTKALMQSLVAYL